MVQMEMTTESLREKEEIKEGQEQILDLGRVVLYLFFLLLGRVCRRPLQVPVSHHSHTHTLSLTLRSRPVVSRLSSKMLARFLR